MTALFLLLLALFPAVILSAPQIQAWVLQQALQQLARGGINVEQPRMDLLEGSAGAARFVLRDGGASAPALLSVQGVEIQYSFKDLLLGDLQGIEIQAAAAQIYVSTTDGVSDPSPLEWLDYHRWLPDQITVDAFHIIHQASETNILYFTELWGRRVDNLSYQLQGELVFDREKLFLDWSLEGLEMAEGLRRVQTELDLLSNEGNRLHLKGDMEGTREAFNYHLSLDSQFQRIEDLPVALATGMDLEGSITLAGRVDGDQTGLTLTNANAEILKGALYEYQVVGDVSYPFNGANHISLSVTGQLQDLEHLIDWVDVDLTDLGQATVEFDLRGSLEQPVVDGLSIMTRHTNGLALSIEGDVDFDTTTLVVSRAKLDVNARAPGLAPLTPWLGDIDFETGPWRASGQLDLTGSTLATDKLTLTLGLGFKTSVNVGGSMRFPTESAGDRASVDLHLGFELPETELAHRLGFANPAIESLFSGEMQLANAEAGYQVTGLLIQHKPSGMQIAGSGSLPSFTSATSTTTTTTTGSNEPNGSRGLQLSGTVTQLKLDYLLARLLPEDSTATLPGTLAGNFRIGNDEHGLHLTHLELQTLDNPPLDLRVRGGAENLLGSPVGQFDTRINVVAGPFLHKLTGLSMGPLALEMESTWQDVLLSTQIDGQVGTSKFESDLAIHAPGSKIQKITGQLHAEDVLLADLGLQELSAEETKGESYVPADHLKPLTQKGYLGRLLRVSPPFDTDLTLDLGRVWGETTRLDRLRLQLTGADHRYMVRDLTLGYQGGLAELRGVIDLVGDPPYFSIAGDIRHLPMSTLTEDLGIETDIKGILSMQGGITSRGLEAGDLAESASGRLAVAAKDLEIRGAAYDVLATDFLAWLYRGMAARKSTRFHCAKAGFSLDTGVAASENLLIESSRMIAKGTANVDIPKGELFIRLLPQSRTRALQIPSQVRIKGKFEAPKVTTSPIAAVLDATAEFISLIPKTALKLLGIKRENYYSPCEP